MKILEINVFNYLKGGSETVFFNTSDQLKRAGHDVVRFALRWDKNIPDRVEKYFPNSKETRKGLLRHFKNIFSYFYNWGAAKNLKKLIRDEKPDIAQIHLIWGQLSPSILRVLKKAKVPAVLTVHDYRLVCPDFLFLNGKGEICEQCKGKYFYKCIVNSCCRHSKPLSTMMAAEQYFRNSFFFPPKFLSGFIFVSDFSKNIHLKYMPALAKVPSVRLYNFASHIDSAIYPKPTNRYFLYFGRLSKEKGIKTLVETFLELPHHRLIIAGTGPLEVELKSFVKNSQAENIDFVGFKNTDELIELIRKAFFVVVPSECYENNPLAIIESFSLSTPVIGSDIGGIPEIVKDGLTGFSFAPFNKDDLKKKITQTDDISITFYNKLRENALNFAKNNFDKDSYVKNLLTFFESLIKT